MAPDRVAGGQPQTGLSIRVLGPVEAARGSQVLDVGGPLEKRLLGVLAVSANHAVSIDSLSDALWGDAPPASRDNTLQTYVSRLRAALGTGRIHSEDHCYQLLVAVDELDSLEFEALAVAAEAEKGDPARRAELCMRGLHLWRGRPFGDFADEEAFRLEAIRLEELKLAVVETRVAAEIALGHENMVIGTLEALVQEHPFRERFWQLLILALALGGRRVEALRSCADLRTVLGGLGLEPGPTVQWIGEAMLSDDGDRRSWLRVVGNGDALAAA